MDCRQHRVTGHTFWFTSKRSWSKPKFTLYLYAKLFIAYIKQWNSYLFLNGLIGLKCLSQCCSGWRVSEPQQHGVLDGRHLHPRLQWASQAERGHPSPGQGLQTACTRGHCRGHHSHRCYSHLHCGVMKTLPETAHTIACFDYINFQQTQSQLPCCLMDVCQWEAETAGACVTVLCMQDRHFKQYVKMIGTLWIQPRPCALTVTHHALSAEFLLLRIPVNWKSKISALFI